MAPSSIAGFSLDRKRWERVGEGKIRYRLQGGHDRGPGAIVWVEEVEPEELQGNSCTLILEIMYISGLTHRDQVFDLGARWLADKTSDLAPMIRAGFAGDGG